MKDYFKKSNTLVQMKDLSVLKYYIEGKKSYKLNLNEGDNL